MQVPARVDYALRAILELAAANPHRVSRDELAERQQLPARYLEAILRDLGQAGLVVGHRGVAGGYEMARPAAEITVADVSRAVDGPLALVGRRRPGTLKYTGSCQHLGELWVGMRAALRSVMEKVTLADLLRGELPRSVRRLLDDPDAWLLR